MAGFENALRATSLAILKRELTESERIEFLELAGAVGMGNVEDYLYMLMIFKRNEDRVNDTLVSLKEELREQFEEIGALERKIDVTLEASVLRILEDGAREIGHDMGKQIAKSASEVLSTNEEFYYMRGQSLVAGGIPSFV